MSYLNLINLGNTVTRVSDIKKCIIIKLMFINFKDWANSNLEEKKGKCRLIEMLDYVLCSPYKAISNK
jgi:hypothetical protein